MWTCAVWIEISKPRWQKVSVKIVRSVSFKNVSSQNLRHVSPPTLQFCCNATVLHLLVFESSFCGKKASREKKPRREGRCLNKNCTFGWSRSHFRFEKTDAEVANFEEESFQRWISLMKKVFGTQRGTYWTRTQPPEILLIEHPHKLTLKRASHHPCESFIYWARVSSLKCKANVVSTNSCHTRFDIVYTSQKRTGRF